MAIREHYGFEGDNRKFDNVMEAVQEAQVASAERGGEKVKVFRSVMYTHSTEPKVSTLTIVQVPAGIPADMMRNPQSFMAEPTITGVRRAAPKPYPTYPVGETDAARAATPALPPIPEGTQHPVPSDNPLTQDPLNKPWKPCYSCGRKK